MFNLLASAFAQFATFFFNKSAVILLTYMALYWLATSLTVHIFALCFVCASLNMDGIQSTISAVTEQSNLAAFLFVYFQILKGMKMILCAYGARFLIRRMPGFG